MSSDCNNICIILLILIFPPFGVVLTNGCGCDLLINILLTILGFFPGHIHAFWLLYKKNEAEKVYGPRGYIYVGNGHFQPKDGQPAFPGHHDPALNPPPRPYETPAAGYGTMPPAQHLHQQQPQHQQQHYGQPQPPTYGEQAKR